MTLRGIIGQEFRQKERSRSAFFTVFSAIEVRFGHDQLSPSWLSADLDVSHEFEPLSKTDLSTQKCCLRSARRPIIGGSVIGPVIQHVQLVHRGDFRYDKRLTWCCYGAGELMGAVSVADILGDGVARAARLSTQTAPKALERFKDKKASRRARSRDYSINFTSTYEIRSVHCTVPV
jgi:hypothetical protein